MNTSEISWEWRMVIIVTIIMMVRTREINFIGDLINELLLILWAERRFDFNFKRNCILIFSFKIR